MLSSLPSASSLKSYCSPQQQSNMGFRKFFPSPRADVSTERFKDPLGEYQRKHDIILDGSPFLGFKRHRRTTNLATPVVEQPVHSQQFFLIMTDRQDGVVVAAPQLLDKYELPPRRADHIVVGFRGHWCICHTLTVECFDQHCLLFLLSSSSHFFSLSLSLYFLNVFFGA